jgi:hypothetical protein
VLELFQPPPTVFGIIPHKGLDVVAQVKTGFHEMGADKPRGASDENFHIPIL